MIRLGKLDDRVVEIVKTQQQVGFSAQQGWILICKDWQRIQRKRQQYLWVPAATRFEWVREFID